MSGTILYWSRPPKPDADLSAFCLCPTWDSLRGLTSRRPVLSPFRKPPRDVKSLKLAFEYLSLAGYSNPVKYVPVTMTGFPHGFLADLQCWKHIKSSEVLEMPFMKRVSYLLVSACAPPLSELWVKICAFITNAPDLKTVEGFSYESMRAEFVFWWKDKTLNF